MCGINGIVYSERSGRSVDRATLARMRDTLEHRGPDEAGLFVDRFAVGPAPGVPAARKLIETILVRGIVRVPVISFCSFTVFSSIESTLPLYRSPLSHSMTSPRARKRPGCCGGRCWPSATRTTCSRRRPWA